jgi:rubrerythrin
MKFSRKELIDIAIQIEDSGYHFYSSCRSKFDDRGFKELFGFLAEEEIRHKELFEKMLGGMGDIRGVFTEDYYSYLKAIGDSRVFKNTADVERLVKEITTINDALKIALTSEKDSILFYTELLSMYESDANAKSLLNRLINEERKHVVTILEISEKLHL